jgi:flagellar motility protein MotE (MotC chaperone)
MFSLLFSLSVFAMPSSDFDALNMQVQNASFSSDKTSVIQLAAQTSTFRADQIKTLIEQIAFNNDQLEALRILAPALEDPSRSFVILEAFSFSSTKKEARDILSRLAPKKSLAEREQEKREREENRLRQVEEKKENIEKNKEDERLRTLKEENERLRTLKEEKKEERREERIEREEGPLFQWVGRCTKRETSCIRFNPKLFSPMFSRKSKSDFPKHDLILEVSGPGMLHLTADLGKKYSCQKDRVVRKSKPRRIERDISLSTGRNLINISDLIPDWRREYVEIEIEKGYLTNMVRLENWKRCQ